MKTAFRLCRRILPPSHITRAQTRRGLRPHLHLTASSHTTTTTTTTMSPRDRRGGGGGGPLPREVTVSKAMSFVLRHGAEKEGIKLDSEGYANVADLLAWHKLRKLQVTLAEVQQIVRTNDKQRFALVSSASSSSSAPKNDDDDHSTPSQPPTDASTYRIRATQGHSIPTLTSTSLSLTPLTPTTAPRTIVHGTYPSAWRLILASGGLKRMGRNHIHFAPEVPDNERGEVVISGMRRSASVLVWVDVRRAMEVGGMAFWRSENGVVLTEGDGEGRVALGFVERVVLRGWGGGAEGERERVLWEGGRVVGDVGGGEGKGLGKAKGKGKGKGNGMGMGQRGDGRRGRRAGIGGGEVDAEATSASPTTATNGMHKSDTGATITLDSPSSTIAST